MNKLLIFPLAFMFLLSIIVLLAVQLGPSGSGTNYTNQSGIYISGSDEHQGEVVIDRAGGDTFDIWGTVGIMVILVAAIAIGTVAGVGILGSGLNVGSQGMIFNSIMFLGTWACLTVLSKNILFDNIMTSMLWFMLTMMFAIGFAQHVNPTGGGM